MNERSGFIPALINFVCVVAVAVVVGLFSHFPRESPFHLLSKKEKRRNRGTVAYFPRQEGGFFPVVTSRQKCVGLSIIPANWKKIGAFSTSCKWICWLGCHETKCKEEKLLHLKTGKWKLPCLWVFFEKEGVIQRMPFVANSSWGGIIRLCGKMAAILHVKNIPWIKTPVIIIPTALVCFYLVQGLIETHFSPRFVSSNHEKSGFLAQSLSRMKEVAEILFSLAIRGLLHKGCS